MSGDKGFYCWLIFQKLLGVVGKEFHSFPLEKVAGLTYVLFSSTRCLAKISNVDYIAASCCGLLWELLYAIVVGIVSFIVDANAFVCDDTCSSILLSIVVSIS